jgi:glutathione S-transferase
MSDERPTLWHIGVSHYSEKVRWALAWKGVEHRRRAPIPSAHMPIALWLTRGAHYTFPVLRLDGTNIGDSTAIVAALEERYPEPPLYPADPAERRRALELEDFFDEQLGPDIRQLVWYEFSRDPQRFAALMAQTMPGPAARMSGASAAYARVFTRLRFNAGSTRTAERSRARVLAALERLEAELGEGDYLVGDRFGVADLTAASLFYPLAGPAEGPVPADQIAAEGFERFRAPLRERRGVQWVREMFRRHRRPAAEAAVASAPAGAR